MAIPARRIPVFEPAAPDAEDGGSTPNALQSTQCRPEAPQALPERRAAPQRSEETTSGAQEEVATAQSEQKRWRQARIELEAAKERMVRETERAKREARAELVAELFPVLDNLERSLASGAHESALREGVELVRSQFAQVLSDFGVERIDSVGQPFDPQEHEAVDVVPVESPSEHNRVQEEWQAGYRHAGRVLRAARVRVGRARGV